MGPEISQRYMQASILQTSNGHRLVFNLNITTGLCTFGDSSPPTTDIRRVKACNHMQYHITTSKNYDEFNRTASCVYINLRPWDDSCVGFPKRTEMSRNCLIWACESSRGQQVDFHALRVHEGFITVRDMELRSCNDLSRRVAELSRLLYITLIFIFSFLSVHLITCTTYNTNPSSSIPLFNKS